MTSPTGQGIVLFGSKGNQNHSSSYIYELSGDSFESLKWTQLDQTLNQNRKDFLALPIPHKLFARNMEIEYNPPLHSSEETLLDAAKRLIKDTKIEDLNFVFDRISDTDNEGVFGMYDDWNIADIFRLNAHIRDDPKKIQNINTCQNFNRLDGCPYLDFNHLQEGYGNMIFTHNCAICFRVLKIVLNHSAFDCKLLSELDRGISDQSNESDESDESEQSD